MADKRRYHVAKAGLVFLMLFLAGCATGEAYDAAKSQIPAIKSDMGRVFVYRSRNPFALFHSRVFTLDGKHIADTLAATVFYYDVKSGQHVVSYNGGRSKLNIDLSSGGKIYLKYSIVSDGVVKGNTLVEVIDPKTAETDLNGLHLIQPMIRHPDELKKLTAK